MYDFQRAGACLIVAVLLFAILFPAFSQAVSIDAIALEMNRTNVKVVVLMPLQTAERLLDQGAPVALSCDVHLGRCYATGERTIIQRKVLVQGRYTMLLTITGESERERELNPIAKAKVDLEAPGIFRQIANKLLAFYKKAFSYYTKALLMALWGMIS
jgi:hypothetical protein